MASTSFGPQSSRPVIRGLDAFKGRADVILANRRHPELDGAAGKIFTRDLSGVD